MQMTVNVCRACWQSRQAYPCGMAAESFLYAQTAERVREQVRTGELAPGQRIAQSLDEMARMYGVGKGTMRKAMEILAAEGVAASRQGRGTFVLDGGRKPAGSSDYSAVTGRIEALEADVMELYAKLGFPQPSHQQDQGRERDEHAG